MTKYDHGPSSAAKPQDSFVSGQALNQNDELSFSEIVRFFASSRYWILAGALCLMLAASFVLFAKELVQPSPVAYSSAVIVTMNGVETGKYPNGSPYSATDLRSAAVLEEVHRVNNLKEFGINLAEFGGMVSVSTYSPAYTILVDRYRQRLSEKNITFEERKQIEAEFQQSIDSLNSSGLIVTFTVDQNRHIPDQIATKVVDDIPGVWADIFTKKLGVVNLPVLVSGSKLVDEALAAKLDYPLAFDYLRQQSDVISSQIKSLVGISGIGTFISTKSKSLEDISRDFAAFRTFQLDLGLKPIVDLGLSKDVELTTLIYENRIKSLNRDAATQSEYSTKVAGVLNSIGTTSMTHSATVEGGPSTNFSAQIDGAFVDKIVQLSEKSSVVDFEKELQLQRLEFENQTVSISDTRTRLAERLSALRQTTLNGIDKQRLEKQFVAGYTEAIGELNDIWGQLVDLSSEFSTSRLNYDKTLYRLSSLPNDVRVSKAAIMDIRSFLMLAVAAILGGFFGALVCLARGSPYHIPEPDR